MMVDHHLVTQLSERPGRAINLQRPLAGAEKPQFQVATCANHRCCENTGTRAILGTLDYYAVVYVPSVTV